MIARPRRVTAIELSADACVIVGARVRGGRLHLDAADLIVRPTPPDAADFVAALRERRRRLRLPRRAHVVLWGAPGGAAPADPAVAALLDPLRRAGFRIDSVVNPCEALAKLARARPAMAQATAAWLAIDRASVAVVVMRDGASLYAQTFPWDSSAGAVGSQAHLLQRFLLVSHLAPQLRHAMMTVDAAHAAIVDAIVTCGNLPDARSLTMPLIEEMDLEVETLDSAQDLDAGPAMKERLAELAPAVRLATAPLLAWRPVSRRSMAGLAVAATIVVAAVVGWAAYSHIGTPPLPRPAVSKTTHGSLPAAVVRPPERTPPDGGTGMAQRPAPAATAATRGTLPPGKATASVPRPPAAPPPVPAASEPVSPPPAAATHPVDAPPAPSRLPPAPPPASPAIARGASSHRAAADRARTPDPLPDPVPDVSTILVSPERRFAVVDGRVIQVGDTIGPRVVTAIEPREIVLREPSGVQIRVGLGGRLLGTVLPRSR